MDINIRAPGLATTVQDLGRPGYYNIGIPLSGGISVGDSALHVDGDLPFSAMMFRGKIESSIREELERLVA